MTRTNHVKMLFLRLTVVRMFLKLPKISLSCTSNTIKLFLYRSYKYLIIIKDIIKCLLNENSFPVIIAKILFYIVVDSMLLDNIIHKETILNRKFEIGMLQQCIKYIEII